MVRGKKVDKKSIKGNNKPKKKTMRGKKKPGKPGKTVKFNGKDVNYNTVNDLATKLRIPVSQAKRLINKSGKRIIVDEDGNAAVGDIKNENINGLLKERFDDTFIQNKSKLKPNHTTKKGTTITDNIDNVELSYRVRVHMYISFPSGTAPSATQFLKEPYKSQFENADPERRQRFIQKIHSYDDWLKLSTLLSSDEVKQNYREHHGEAEYNIVHRKLWIKNFLGNKYTVEKKVNKAVRKYMDDFIGDRIYLLAYSHIDLTEFTKQVVRKEEGRLLQDAPLRLTEWLNICYDNVEGGDTCCVNFISKKFPKYYKDIKEIETHRGVKFADFMEFCEDRGISYKFYDHFCKLLHEYNGDTGMIHAIIYNNHIYPTVGGKPKRALYNAGNTMTIYVKDSYKNFDKILKKNILAGRVVIDVNHDSEETDIGKNDLNVVSCIIKRIDHNPNYVETEKDPYTYIKFICNSEHKECLRALTILGFEAYIYDNIKLTHLPDLLAKLLGAPNIHSFYPEKSLLKQGAVIYEAEDIEEYDDLKCEDGNKFYTSILYSLDYLLKFDYRTGTINMNPKRIVKTNCYWVEPEYHTILIKHTGLYPGYFLKKCASIGLKFKLLEELVCDYEVNFYKTDIIPMLQKSLSEKSFKKVMNIFIGALEANIRYEPSYKYKGIFTDESLQYESGYTNKIGDHTLLFDHKDKCTNVRDRMFVAIQIKCGSRMALFERIQKLGLKDEDIKQIKTDSFSYIGELSTDLNNELCGWKKAEIKIIGMGEKGKIDHFRGLSFTLCNNILDDYVPVQNENILYLQYAGGGKTYIIINELIPQLIKEGKTYIVLTPTHSMLGEIREKEIYDGYKKVNINCDVISKYTFANTIPDVDVVIFDEIGFMPGSAHDLLFKLKWLGKKYICFGDFNQLPAIGENKKYNQPHYLNYMFGKIITEFTNHRNNFTTKYYDDLIHKRLDLIKEVKRHAVNIDETENILCYRNKTREKYNNIILKEKGYEYMNEIGVKIICKTNKLLKYLADNPFDEEPGEYRGIYNNKQFEIMNIDDDIYTLHDEKGDAYLVTEKELFRNFELGYVSNIHRVQGKTLENYYWIDEDDHFLIDKLDGSVAYTIISRLRQDIIKK